MKNLTFLTFIIGVVLLLGSCKQEVVRLEGYKSESLIVKPLTDHILIHVSYLDIPNYGKFPCNGMVLIDEGEALIFDTPTSDEVGEELIDILENTYHLKIKGVIVNHFHIDCLGGLTAFHEHTIPSYCTSKTAMLAQKDSVTIPMNTFDDVLDLNIGNQLVINKYFGAGHTVDNIVSYVPKEKVLFGGCMIKELGAGNGNLADANVEEWSNTVAQIKKAYPGIEIVIPGHGKEGGIDLLDYTIEKFKID